MLASLHPDKRGCFLFCGLCCFIIPSAHWSQCVGLAPWFFSGKQAWEEVGLCSRAAMLLALTDLSLSSPLEPFLPQFPPCSHPGPYTPCAPAAALVEIKRDPSGEAGGEGWLRAAALRRKLTPRPALHNNLWLCTQPLGPRPHDSHCPNPAVSFPSSLQV